MLGKLFLLRRIVHLGVFLIETLASTSQYLQEEGLQTVLPAHITSVLCSSLNVSGIRKMSRNLEDKPCQQGKSCLSCDVTT